MALQSINFKGLEILTAYTRLEARVNKQLVVTQKYVPAVEAVEAQEAVLDEEGNVVTPAVEAVAAVAEVPEVKEMLSIITIVSYTWANKEIADQLGETLDRPQVEGFVKYQGGDVLGEAYTYAKTLDKFANSTDV